MVPSYPVTRTGIFDRKVKALQRARAARLKPDECDVHGHFADAIADRISLVKGDRQFSRVLEVGCHRTPVSAALLASGAVVSRGIKSITLTDMSAAVLEASLGELRAAVSASGLAVEVDGRCLDEDGTTLVEAFGEEGFDMVVSSLSLHWVNDVEGTFTSARRLLKPDGLFCGALLGGTTLAELSDALAAADRACRGGVSPHVVPFLSAQDVANVMVSAGFAFPCVDAELCTKWFSSGAAGVMAYLRAIGEGACLTATAAQKRRTPPRVFAVAGEAYEREHGEGDDGVPASFEAVTFVGWRPAPWHTPPARRGSASVRLDAVLELADGAGGGALEDGEGEGSRLHRRLAEVRDAVAAARAAPREEREKALEEARRAGVPLPGEIRRELEAPPPNTPPRP